MKGTCIKLISIGVIVWDADFEIERGSGESGMAELGFQHPMPSSAIFQAVKSRLSDAFHGATSGVVGQEHVTRFALDGAFRADLDLGLVSFQQSRAWAVEFAHLVQVKQVEREFLPIHRVLTVI